MASPGWRWGPFTARLPGLHHPIEWPELIQGLLVTSATGLAVTPIYAAEFGMAFETAVALVVIQSVLICSAFFAFGDPYCPGWLTPALPLVLAEAARFETTAERVDFVNAVVLTVGLVFLLLGLSGWGQRFVRATPRVLRAVIILGAGAAAIYGEFLPRSGGRPARIDAYTVSILAAAGLTAVLMFSRPLEGWKRRRPWLARLASLGIAPGFFLAMALGPWTGEIRYDAFLRYDGPVLFWPNFAELIADFSLLGRGLPPLEHFARALPLALAAYVIGFGDMVTGSAIVYEAGAKRPDPPIPLDERRTHLQVGLRNSLMALVGGPFFPLQGPLWAGATIVVAERYRRGEMRSWWGGVSSYYLFGLPAVYFIRPLLELLRPALDVAFSLTLLLTGFGCAYVALALVEDRIERGIAVFCAILMLQTSFFVGLAAGLVLTLALLGRAAWRPAGAESEQPAERRPSKEPRP